MNPPKRWHPELNSNLFRVLAPLAETLGLSPYCESTGVYADVETDWRVPDQVYARAHHEIDDGVTGAELVVEVRSPGDESYAKLPFYAKRGITEVLIVDRERHVALYRLGGAAYEPVEDGRSSVLGVTFATVDGPKLRITWDGGSADV